MRKNLFLVVLATTLLFGCKSEQEKALDAAIATNDLNVLREFAAANADVMEEKVKALYDTTYNRLIKDSTLYSAIGQAESILVKYGAEKDYLAALPNGIHASEVTVSMNEHKEKAEELSAYLDQIRSAFSKYIFIEKEYIGGFGGQSLTEDVCECEFLEPDRFGKGEVRVKGETIKDYSLYFPNGTGESAYDLWRYEKRYDYTIVCTRTGSYYIDDEKKIILSINESRTYDLTIDKSSPKYSEELKFLKRKYPTAKPRKLILELLSETGFPILRGKDSNRNDCYFESAMKQ